MHTSHASLAQAGGDHMRLVGYLVAVAYSTLLNEMFRILSNGHVIEVSIRRLFSFVR